MHVRSAVAFMIIGLATLPARAGDGAFALSLDGAESGTVSSVVTTSGNKKSLTLTTEQPSAPLLATVHAFLDGTMKKSNIVLSTPALVQKATDARLVDVRLPSYAGGASGLALTFEVGAMSSGPSLRAINGKTKPAAARISGFRLSMGDLPTSEASRLDSLAVAKKEGAIVPTSLSFDVPSRDAPRYLAWTKKPAAREGAVEYVSATGEVMLALKVGGCTAQSARIDGPVTHVTVQCLRAARAL